MTVVEAAGENFLILLSRCCQTLNVESNENGVLDDIMRVRMPESTCRSDSGSILIMVGTVTLRAYSALRFTNLALLAATHMEIISPSAWLYHQVREA